LTNIRYHVRGRVDRLVRLHGAYSPVEIKLHNKPTPADLVQLDFYVWLLEQIQGTQPPAELWLGADAAGRPRTRLSHDYDEERLMSAFAQVLPLLNNVTEPPIRLEHHCKECPWYSACQTAARAEGNLDLLYNVPHHIREHLRQAGFQTLAHIASAPPGELQRVKGIKHKTEAKIRANAQAWIDNQPVWLTPLPDLPAGWMFDLETCEVNQKLVPWCMGWCDTEGNTQIALVGLVQTPERLTTPNGTTITLAPDSDGIWEVFAESVSVRNDPIYHWSPYDAALLRCSAPSYVKSRLEPRMVDMHAILKRTLSLPLKSTSIKVVSTYLGFDWPGHQDYRAAYIDYRYWLDSGDPEALVRASVYQGADVQSMAHVWRWLVNCQM
jgi:predicted RecB family nuclease